MTDRHLLHRPLLAGVEIIGVKLDGDQRTRFSAGALTGLATRSIDRKKMLVTNRHIIVDDDSEGADTIYDMYQHNFPVHPVPPDPGVEHLAPIARWSNYTLPDAANGKVGQLVKAAPRSKTSVNTVDIAMCGLEDGVTAEFAFHHENHATKTIPIVAGIKEPHEGMKLRYIGARSGDHIVTVKAIGTAEVQRGYSFSGITHLELSRSGLGGPGDSGAPCLYLDEDGNYRLCCIVYFGDEDTTDAWAMPASAAENALGITFGNRPPVAKAKAPQTATRGATVTLNGEGQCGPRRL